MRPLGLAALTSLLALAIAGCITQTAPLSPTAASSKTGGWKLDCTLGSYEHARNPAWVQECVARGSHTPGPKAEIWLGVNPKDPDNVVISSKDENPESSTYCVWNGLAVTHDGGKTWKDVVIGGKWNERTPDSPYYGYACNTDPDFAFSPNGDVHYAVELYNFLAPSASGPLGPDPIAHRALLAPGWKQVLATSHDGGDTWPDAVVQDFGDGVAAVNDYHRTIVSPKTGTILTALISTSGGPVSQTGKAYTDCHVLASRDGGKTADVPVTVVGQGSDGLPRINCNAIAAAPDGTIVLMGKVGTGVSGVAQESVDPWYISWSADDGRTFSTPKRAFDIHSIPGVFNESKYRTGNNFELAYDMSSGPSRGTLYALYAANDRGNADVYLRSSTDNGHTWGEAVRVNDDRGNGSQWLPNLAIPNDGSIHAFFLDKRWDPANKLIDVTHAVSLDGGKTWANERVTNVSWDGDLGRHQERQSFIGDYIGAGSGCVEPATGGSGGGTHCVVWAGFPDASNGEAPVIAAARVTKG